MRLWFAAFIWLALAVHAAAEEKITRFAGDVTVNVDASLDVTEQIEVIAEGNRIRRGIFRDFPTRYRTASGQNMSVGFEVLSVTMDGRAAPYVVENISGGKRVRIGDADVSISTGPHTYVLRYRTTRQIGFFENYDELYWNVTGNGWEFEIDRATVTIELPPGAVIRQHAAYTGAVGEQGREFNTIRSRGNSFAVETTAPLLPGQGLTVAVSWQKGLIATPEGGQKALWFIEDNGWLFAGLGTALLAGLYFLGAWFAVGRDPPRRQVIPLFRPPQGFGPADVRYVSRQGFDGKTFAAALVGLAVKGRARIEDDDSSYKVAALAKGGQAELSASEAALLKAMPAGSLALKQSNHAMIGKMQSALSDTLETNYKGSHFARNLGWFAGGALVSIAGLALAALLLPGEQGPVVLFMSIWLIVWWSIVLVSIGSVVKRLRSARGAISKIGSAFSLLFLVPFVVAGLAVPAGVLVFDQLSPELVFFACIVAALLSLNFLFYYLLKAPTEIGQQKLAEIEGFRMYLSTAEEERLNMLNPPEKTPELFERYLPYAIALDCENEWGEKFAAVLAAAAAAGAAAAPVWYSGNNWNSRTPGDFASGLGKSFASTLSSSASAPGSSSGSGGGGSSGGGGGGGGGGGW